MNKVLLQALLQLSRDLQDIRNELTTETKIAAEQLEVICNVLLGGK